ncbi:MAG TPA: division plane positioning ATPase MipZ, partial [Verrucomicrobiae bacterium]|nr:division plane positioning ATPase MipZ [Verrucomicrobiae bacterium]
MKRLILILNGKGGVGKSFFAVNFVQFLKDKGIVHVAIDSDNENSTLKRFHPDTRFLDLSKRRDLDAIFSALAKTNLVVVDCRAASTDLFIDFFHEIDLPAVLTALDAKLTLVMPVNHESDSVDQIQRMTDEFKNRCNYV